MEMCCGGGRKGRAGYDVGVDYYLTTSDVVTWDAFRVWCLLVLGVTTDS